MKKHKPPLPHDSVKVLSKDAHTFMNINVKPHPPVHPMKVFPRRIKLKKPTNKWKLEEVQKWIEDQRRKQP